MGVCASKQPETSPAAAPAAAAPAPTLAPGAATPAAAAPATPEAAPTLPAVATPAATAAPTVSASSLVSPQPLQSDRAALERAVLAEIGDTLALIEVDLEEDRIILLQPLHFTKGSSKPLDVELFGEIVKQLAAAINICNRARADTGHHAFHFIVAGHADVAETNALDPAVLKLTQLRANKVKNLLLAAGVVADAGDDNVLNARGYGGCLPLEPYAGKTGERRNMRVEIHSATRTEARAAMAEPLAWRAPPLLGAQINAPSNAAHEDLEAIATEGFVEAGRRKAERDARAAAVHDGGMLLADYGEALFADHFGAGLVLAAEEVKAVVAARSAAAQGDRVATRTELDAVAAEAGAAAAEDVDAAPGPAEVAAPAPAEKDAADARVLPPAPEAARATQCAGAASAPAAAEVVDADITLPGEGVGAGEGARAAEGIDG